MATGRAQHEDSQPHAPHAAAPWPVRRLRQAVSLLSSTLVHLLLLVVLALWTVAVEVHRPPPTLIASQQELADDTLLAADVRQDDRLSSLATSEPVFSALDAAVMLREPSLPDVIVPSALPASPEWHDSAGEMAVSDGLPGEVAALGRGGLTGRRGAARGELLEAGGGNAQSEEAVERALDWLARHQNRDGSWSFDHTRGACQGQCANPGRLSRCTTGATGLALLPFLGAGYTHRDGKYQDAVSAGLNYLIARMQSAPEGRSLTEGGEMYDHGIASIALCEAYAMTQDRTLEEPAQAAIDFIVYTQDPLGGGWRYMPRQPGDTSQIGWQLMALKSAHLAYLRVPPKTISGVVHFLNSVQSDNGAAYGYVGAGKAPGTSSVGLLCRMLLGWKRDLPALRQGVRRLAKIGPSPSDVYFNYYATQVLHHYEGKLWRKWNARLRDYLVETQTRLGHESGTWFFTADNPSLLGGRLYATAMCAMTLEVYYRHLPLYSRESIENQF